MKIGATDNFIQTLQMNMNAQVAEVLNYPSEKLTVQIIKIECQLASLYEQCDTVL